MTQDSTNPTRPAEKARWRGFTQLALLLLAIAVALYFARAPSRVERGPVSGTAQAKLVATIVKPVATDHVLTVNLTGTVNLARKTTVVSEVVGRVNWVSPAFSNGGTIPANETFIKIDPAEYRLEVEAAKMAVKEAEAHVQIEKDRAGEVARAQAQLGKARAALALAELRLDRTEISLPFACRVISSDLEVGDLVGPAEAVGRMSVLGVVYRPDALQVRVPIGAEDLADLAPAVGRSARIHTDGGTFSAEVMRVSSAFSPKTRLAAVFLKFTEDDSSDRPLPLPGAFADVEISGPELDNVFVLPKSSAWEHDKVWVVRNGVSNSATVRTIARTDAGWVVEAFDAGEGVVVDALSGAREGQEVDASQATTSSQ